MFTYQIRYFPCNKIYLTGLRHSLNELLTSNFGWQYCMMPLPVFGESECHLTIIDATEYEGLCEFPKDVVNLLKRRSSLVLVKMSQKALTLSLVKDFNCSVLCVDERHFLIREIIESTIKKTRYFSASVARYQQTPCLAEPVMFTPAERSVLQYLRKGYTGAKISRLLFRSEKTVSSHKRNIMRKLGTKTEIELAKAIQHC